MAPISTLACKPNLRDVHARLKSLYAREAGDRVFATMAVPNPAIAEFAASHAKSECRWPDPAERTKFWDDFFRHRASIQDDSMPGAYLSEFDQGLYGALLGAEVRFIADPSTGWISSMVPPLLKDWSDFDRLQFDPSHPWWQRYLDQLDLFVQASAGKWGISHFILIDAMNFVFELVGATQAYLGVEDHPDTIRRAIDFAFDLNVRIHEQFFKAVPSLDGGTFSNFGQWFPGRVVSESIDPYHMTSVAYFERWGREPAERIMTHFDGGVIHIHANGRHLLEASCTLRGLKAIVLMDDKGFPTSLDIIDQLRTRTGDVPLTVWTAPYDAFIERLRRHTLPGGVLYYVQDVPSADAANRTMDEVRAYRC
ncbi:MAG: hypothetical protein LLG00_09885 [Planctomycetaceae bacterium]|nr:hypothetical protein [Planctomycetaceae bacterium]